MRFLVDAQLPPALARFLASEGHHADHVEDFGLTAAPDRVIWKHALDHDSIIVTKDEDFVTLRAIHAQGPPVIWIRIGNTTRDSLVRMMSSALPQIVAALQRGESIVEVTGS